jgi:aspartyl-tRNA(Asn)/glutamyl-tRNA(Gln) amidotransferase subunit C
MDKKIDISQVRQVAKLSRLQLDEETLERFSTQLSAILKYIEKLNEINTDGIEPLAHCLPVSNVFRDDMIKASMGVEKTLSNSPQRDGEFFKVPKIIEETGRF